MRIDPALTLLLIFTADLLFFEVEVSVSALIPIRGKDLSHGSRKQEKAGLIAPGSGARHCR